MIKEDTNRRFSFLMKINEMILNVTSEKFVAKISYFPTWRRINENFNWFYRKLGFFLDKLREIQ